MAVIQTYQTSWTCTTKDRFDFVDITDDVEGIVEGSRVMRGRVTVYSPGDTCSLLLNERESGLLKDIRKALDRVTEGGFVNPPTTIGNKSVVMPVVGGRLRLGTWQRLLLLELESGRDRDLVIEVIGE